jgi:hypothetical protein
MRPSVLVVLSDQQLGVVVTVALTYRCPENSGKLGGQVAPSRQSAAATGSSMPLSRSLSPKAPR